MSIIRIVKENCCFGTAKLAFIRAERAVALLEVLKPESNHLVEKFRNAGMRIDNALTSQAVIQLNNAYCVPRKCLYCEAGHKLLSLK